jgi:hypothetical protein
VQRRKRPAPVETGMPRELEKYARTGISDTHGNEERGGSNGGTCDIDGMEVRNFEGEKVDSEMNGLVRG